MENVQQYLTISALARHRRLKETPILLHREQGTPIEDRAVSTPLKRSRGAVLAAYAAWMGLDRAEKEVVLACQWAKLESPTGEDAFTALKQFHGQEE